MTHAPLPPLPEMDLVEMAADLRQCFDVVHQAKAHDLMPPLIGSLAIAFELWRRSASLHLLDAEIGNPPEGIE